MSPFQGVASAAKPKRNGENKWREIGLVINKWSGFLLMNVARAPSTSL